MKRAKIRKLKGKPPPYVPHSVSAPPQVVDVHSEKELDACRVPRPFPWSLHVWDALNFDVEALCVPLDGRAAYGYAGFGCALFDGRRPLLCVYRGSN